MTLRLAVLGDSIAWGEGADRPEERLPHRLAEALREHGLEVELRVLAVSGARSADLAGQVDRLGDESPDVVVVVIGANDLTHLVPAERAAEALDQAVARLRARGAEVVVAPAPDLSAVPRVPAELRATVREASNRLRDLQAAAVRRHGGHVADDAHSTSAAFAADRSLFSADRFHPSSAGYAVILATLLPTVLEAVQAARA